MKTRSTRSHAARYAALVALAGVLPVPSPAQAIVGGVDATRPYASTVIVHLRGADGTFRQRCAGNVISRHGHVGVLTNAICVTPPGSSQPYPAADIRITAGTTPDRAGGRPIAVTDVRVAAGWDWAAPGPDGQPDKVSDFAVLILADTRNLHPIALTSAVPGTPVRLVGQGNTSTGQPAPRLQQLDGARIVDPGECADILISDGEICVRPAAGTNLGAGDGGSPALTRSHGGLKLAGTASRTGCTCSEKLVSVYTDPAANIDEITDLLTHPTTNKNRRNQPTGARTDLWTPLNLQ